VYATLWHLRSINFPGKRIHLFAYTIISSNDAEGAGEHFNVTNFDIANPPKREQEKINYKEDFFWQAG